MPSLLTKMTNIKIDIVSDVVCPWCYIGYRRLQTAIRTHQAAYPSTTFTLTLKPFYLNASAPPSGTPLRSYLANRFGGAARVDSMLSRLRAVGASEGIDFNFDSKTGNTRSAHRVLELARQKGVQLPVAEEIWKGYFEEGGDVTDREFLAERGAAGGLDGEEVRAWVESGEGGNVVDREVGETTGVVFGVPNFRIQNGWTVDGAQEPEEFQGLFERIEKTEANK